MVTMDRNLGLAGAPNARDLGGLTTRCGWRVRPGLLVRAGALAYLTDADVAVLARLRPATVVDLRGEGEVTAAGPDRLPDPPPRVVAAPVFDPHQPVFTHVARLLEDPEHVLDGALTPDRSVAAMRGIYRWFVADPGARASFAAAVRATLAGPPAVFHCGAGKDRAGWLSVILLTALGLPQAAIEADYLRSNPDTSTGQSMVLATLRAQRPDVDPAAIEPILEARPDYLAAGYDEARARYGSIDGYLEDGLGLTGPELSRLDGFLEPPGSVPPEWTRRPRAGRPG